MTHGVKGQGQTAECLSYSYCPSCPVQMLCCFVSRCTDKTNDNDDVSERELIYCSGATGSSGRPGATGGTGATGPEKLSETLPPCDGPIGECNRWNNTC